MRSWERAKLRHAAVRYAQRGWHVMPGAYHVGGGLGRRPGRRRFDCGEAGCRTVACHPVIGEWEDMPRMPVAAVTEWWRPHPYTVLLATGHEFDVIDVPAALGRAALLGDGFTAARGPVAVTPAGRWLYFVRPGHGLLPDLAQLPAVLLHGLGSWVPAPPSRQLNGRVRWEIAPEQHDWTPSEPYAVQRLMSEALFGVGGPARPIRTAWAPSSRAA